VHNKLLRVVDVDDDDDDDDVAESVHCSTDDGFILVRVTVETWCRKYT
jgi:hypothetical protein